MFGISRQTHTFAAPSVIYTSSSIVTSSYSYYDQVVGQFTSSRTKQTASLSSGRIKQKGTIHESPVYNITGSAIWVRPDDRGDDITLTDGVTEEFGNVLPASGSLFKEVVDKYLIKAAASEESNIYTTKSYPTFVRNLSFWLSGSIGLTGISPWNSASVGQSGQQSCFAISPRHLIGASHAPPGTPSTASFITSNNILVERGMYEFQQIGNTDLSIGIMDSDLPNTIETMSLAGSDLIDYLSIASSEMFQYTKCPLAVKVQSQDMYACDIRYIDSNFTQIINSGSLTITSSLWGTVGAGGDSGGPMCILVGNTLIVLSHLYTSGTGPNYANLYDEINAKMEELSNSHSVTIYTVTTQSLTDFVNYG